MNSPMTEQQAPEILKQQDDQGVMPLQFEVVDEYTTFIARFAIDDNDLIFHFYLPAELVHVPTVASPKPEPYFQARVDKYWNDNLPRTLDIVARDFFKAEAPRLKAAFTPEMNSWWLRGFGMADVLDPAARARAFLAKFDQALDVVNVNQRKV